MDNIKKYAVIVAGGKGLRMNSAVPKQFLPIAGKPLLYYSIKAFMGAFADVELILVLPADQLSYAQMVLQCFEERIDIKLVTGGETRFHSVQNGLGQIDMPGVVFVHDGVRPFVSPQLIQRCYQQALEKGSAIPATPMTDSVRTVDGESSTSINRDNLRIIQTPQTFRTEVILPAFARHYDAAFTDEATVVEAHGIKIFLVEGERNNIKVTTPEDMAMAEAMMNNAMAGDNE